MAKEERVVLGLESFERLRGETVCVMRGHTPLHIALADVGFDQMERAIVRARRERAQREAFEAFRKERT